MPKKRNASFEILRIVSMFMVTVMHCIGTFAETGGTVNSVNGYLFWFVDSLCFVAVNLFVLINGYFMVKAKFKLSKLLTLWLEIIFYSLGLYILGIVFGETSFSPKGLLNSVAPIVSGEYWFISVYVVLYILSPLLNITVARLTKKQLQCSVGVMLVLFSLVPTVFGELVKVYPAFKISGGYSLMWFVVLYFTGAYLRLYPNEKKIRKPSTDFLLYLLFAFVTFISRYAVAFVCGRVLHTQTRLWNFYEYNSVTVYLASVFLFIAFSKIRVKENSILEKTVLFLSPCSLAVYIIHLNPVWRDLLWNKLVNVNKYAESCLYLPYVLAMSLAVYVVFSLADYLRILLFKLIDTPKFRERCDRLQGKIYLAVAAAVEKIS